MLILKEEIAPSQSESSKLKIYEKLLVFYLSIIALVFLSV